MFENPPAWTVPIANLTGWFDWQAIGGIGTIAVVMVALWQSGKADREVARQRKTLISGYVKLIEVALIPLSDFDEDRVSDLPTSEARELLNFWEANGIEQALDSYSFRDFPTHGLWTTHMGVRATLRSVRRCAEAIVALKGPKSPIETIQADTSYLRKSLVDFRWKEIAARPFLERLGDRSWRSRMAFAFFERWWPIHDPALPPTRTADDVTPSKDPSPI